MYNKIKYFLKEAAILKVKKEETTIGDSYYRLTFLGIPVFKKFIEKF